MTMCISENRASQAARYVNAQLTALYENAVVCLETLGNAENTDDQHRYSYALAEFSDFGQSRGRTLKDRMFHAVFDQPHIDFICNHDAIFRLKIRYGFYHIEQVFSVHEHPITIADVDAEFCVSFERERHLLPASRTRKHQNAIQLIVFDFMNAQLVSAAADVALEKNTLDYYLSRYLKFLQDAGNNIMVSLPELDTSKPTIDFSLFSSAYVNVGRTKISNVSVREINSHLGSSWFKASTLSSEQTSSSNWRAISLAEFNSVRALPGMSKIQFLLSFGPPRLKLICSREAVVTFNLSDVKFFDGPSLIGDPVRQYGACEIAVLFNIHHETEHEGKVVRCKLDVKTARIVDEACKLPRIDDKDEAAMNCWAELLQFFVPGYVEILESANYHIVYYDDERWRDRARIPDSGDNPFPPNSRQTAREGMATDADLHGFDQVMVFSQASVNAHLYDLYSRSLKDPDFEWLSSWLSQSFYARMFPMTCRLLSNNKVILWVNVRACTVKFVDGQVHECADVRLAFEVDLKMFSNRYLYLSQSGLQQLQDSLAYRDHASDGGHHFKHICLDFTSCTFLHEYSTLENLFDDANESTAEIAKSIIDHIKQDYFSELMAEGLHILYTIPLCTSKDTQQSPHALTDVTFRVHSNLIVDRRNWFDVPGTAAPIIVILGMCNLRKLPFRYLDLPPSWHVFTNQQVSHGTLAINRTVFLQDFLLTSLAYINRATTLIPEFSRPKDGRWEPGMIPWAAHCFKNDHPCQWQLESEQDGCLRYVWKNLDGWNYEHESGPTNSMNGSYAVSCGTRNYLEIPTSYSEKELDIKLWGEIDLRLSYRSSRTHWSVKSSAKWNVALAMVTESIDLHLELKKPLSTMFDFARNEIEGDVTVAADANALLKDSLQYSIDLSPVTERLRAFEGVWESCYPGLHGFTLAHPSFTAHGDIILELRSFGQPSYISPNNRQALTNGSLRSAQSSRGGSPRSSISPLLSPHLPPSMSPSPPQFFNPLSPRPSQVFSRPYTRNIQQTRTVFASVAHGVAIASRATVVLPEDEHIDDIRERGTPDGDRP